MKVEKNTKNISIMDRILGIKFIELENSNKVQYKRSDVPIYLLLLFIIIAISIQMTDFNISIIMRRINQLFVILGKIFTPKWDFMPKVIEPLIETIKMSILGSVIGSTLALPFAILASSNVNKNNYIVSAIRFLLSMVRTLPTLIIANISALIFSLGSFAGTVAISIFTFGIVAKMLFESIETIDMGAFEAMESMGATKFQAFWSALMPQILPTYLAHSLYCFEINIRAASILGYVGAGGLGITINERVGWRDYNGLGTVLITLFVAVLLINIISEKLREKLS